MLMLFVFSLKINAQDFSSTVDTTNIKIGEQIIYKINAITDSLNIINFPENKDFSPFEVTNEFKLDTSYLDKKYIITKQFALTHFTSGDYYIPTQKVQFLNKEFQLDSIKIKVNSVVTDTTKQGLYGIKPIMESNTQIDYLYWFYVFGIFSIIGFAIYYRKKILSLFTIQKIDVKYFTPYEKAVNDLKKIKKLKYESNVDIKNYYSNLTFIVRNFIEEKLISNVIKCPISVKDTSVWENDTGALLRKDLNPITCMVMFGKTSSKKITPAQVDARKGIAIKFWETIQNIKYFGAEGSRKKTVAAQPVVLQAIARLAFDLAYGRTLLKDSSALERLWLEISSGKLDFTHKNIIWGSLMLSNQDRAATYKGLDKYIYVPYGTNLDAGTHDPKTGWIRYGQKRNDIYPRLGDVIRFKLGLSPRPSVTKALISIKK